MFCEQSDPNEQLCNNEYCDDVGVVFFEAGKGWSVFVFVTDDEYNHLCECFSFQDGILLYDLVLLDCDNCIKNV